MSSFPDTGRRTAAESAAARPRIRQHSEISAAAASSSSIDVPNPSRKRRTSESRLEQLESGYSSGSSGYSSSLSSSLLMRSGEDVRECTAAMVLMNLSASPTDRFWGGFSQHSSCLQSPQASPVSSEASNHLVEEDEEPSRKQQRCSDTRVMYRCTWRGCHHLGWEQEAMERHVRGHLGRPEPGPDEERDFEEEFYYTEVDADDQDMDEVSKVNF